MWQHVPPTKHLRTNESIHACPTRMLLGVKQLVLSVCHLSSERNCNLAIIRLINSTLTLKTITKQRVCTLWRPKQFYSPHFYLTSVRFAMFNTVNSSDTVEARHTHAMYTCSYWSVINTAIGHAYSLDTAVHEHGIRVFHAYT